MRLPGLKAPVEVLFDGYGVPHVYAAGRRTPGSRPASLHARERLWQMELYRRATRAGCRRSLASGRCRSTSGS